MNIKRKVRFALMVFCATSILINGFMLVHGIVDYRRGEDSYNNLASVISTPEEKPTLVESDNEGSTYYDVPDFSVNFDTLLKTNEDCVGWIYIPNLDISYPICRSHDNQEYLKLTFNKTKSSSGCLFTDCRIDDPFKQRTILYGHNMKNGTMFANLFALEAIDDTSSTKVWIYLPDKTIQCYAVSDVLRTTSTDSTVYDLNGNSTELVLSTCVRDDTRLVIICDKVGTFL